RRLIILAGEHLDLTELAQRLGRFDARPGRQRCVDDVSHSRRRFEGNGDGGGLVGAGLLGGGHGSPAGTLATLTAVVRLRGGRGGASNVEARAIPKLGADRSTAA